LNATAVITGIGLGLAYYGGLWLSLRNLLERRPSWPRFVLGQLARLGLAAVVFVALLRADGPTGALLGLGGMLAARWWLTGKIGRAHHD
jgi:F1F0 ATPase subunit 2